MIKNFKYLRLKRGLSQLQVAKDLKISQQTIYKYENKSTEPDLDRLIAIARYFDTSVDFLVGNTDIEQKYEETCSCELTRCEQDVIDCFRESNKDQRELLLHLLSEFTRNRTE